MLRISSVEGCNGQGFGHRFVRNRRAGQLSAGAELGDRATVWTVDLRDESGDSARETTRTALRTILSRLCEVDPSQVAIDNEPGERPRLRSPESDLQFSVSHTAGRALIAVTHRARVGVDIECTDREVDVAGVAGRYFHEAEQRRLAASAEGDRKLAFFRHWTAKEAYVKGLGTGLSTPLDSFEVDVSPDRQPSLVTAEAGHTDWSLHELPVGSGWIATLAVEGPAAPPRLLDFDAS